jgi:hypothetical protein
MHFPEEVVEKASPRGAHVAGRVVIVDGEDSVGGGEGGVLAAIIIKAARCASLLIWII